jgi:hypothetical protein
MSAELRHATEPALQPNVNVAMASLRDGKLPCRKRFTSLHTDG